MTFRARLRPAEGLLVFSLLFGPIAFGATERWSWTILEAGLISATLVCCLTVGEQRRRGSAAALVPPLSLAGIGLLQSCRNSFLLGPAPLLPFTPARVATWRAVIKIAACASLVWSVPRALPDRAALRRLLWALFLVGVFVAIVGLAQRAEGNAFFYGLRAVRRGAPFGPYTNRDHAASLMAMSFLIGGGILISRFPGRHEWLGAGEVADWVAAELLVGALMAVLLFAIVQTRSRGAVLSMAISAGAVACLMTLALASPALQWRSGLALAAGTTLFSVFLYRHPIWIGYRHGALDESAGVRVSLYHSALILFRDFPIAGSGLGAFRQVFAPYESVSLGGAIVEHPHSDWLELAVETGFAGVVAYGLSLGACLMHAVRRWLSLRPGELYGLGAGALAAGVSFLVHGLVETPFQIPANAAIFFAVLAVFSGLHCWRFASGKRAVRQSHAKVPLCLSAAALACLFLVEGLGARSAEDFYGDAVFAARQAEIDPTRRMNHLRQALVKSVDALQVEPSNPRFRSLEAELLLRIGRSGDASRFIIAGQAARLEP